MKCNNCGTEFEGRFCPNCGTKAEQEITPTAVNDLNVDSQSVVDVKEEVVNSGNAADTAQPFANNDGYAAQDFNVAQTFSNNGGDAAQTSLNNSQINFDAQPNADYAKEYEGASVQNADVVPKKKSKKLPILLSIGSVVVVAAILIAVFFPYVSNFFVKTFSSPGSYYKYVEGKSALKLAGECADSLDVLSEKDQKADSEISLEISDSFKQYIRTVAPDELNTALSEIDSVTIVTDSNMKGDDSSQNAHLKINDDVLLSCEVSYYADNETMYLKVPELSDKYLCAKVSDDEYPFGDMQFTPQDLYNAIPKSDQIKTLVKDYFNITVDNIDEITESGDTLTVDEVKSNCTLLKLEISEEDAVKILEGILEYAKDDNNLKEIIENFDNELNLDKYDEDEFVNVIEDALSDIKTYSGTYDTSLKIVYNVWTDGKGEIVGREITDNENNFSFKILSPEEGNKVAYEVSFETEGQKIAVVGSGTKNGNKVTSDMNFEINGLKMINISTKDFYMENNESSGCVSIKTGDDLMGILQMTGMNSELTSLINDSELKFTLDGNRKESKFNLELLVNGENYLTLKTNAKISKAEKIESAPTEAYNANDSAEMSKWAESLKMTEFLDSIKDYTFLSSLMGISSNSVYNNYDSYDDYDYYSSYDY